jgi:tripartite-type tricarboxylate transporter receptor subunit TctC
MKSKKIVLAVGALLFISCIPAFAQTFPSRPITLVVPAAAGGTTDILGRIIAQGMSKSLGQNVVVENVAGAGGTVGTQRVARATADGYTINIGNMGTLAANVSLYPKLNFDARRDFDAIGIVANVPMVIAVSNKSGFKDLKSFLDYMSANPDKVNFGTPGVGSTGHLAPMFLLQTTKLKATLVSYRGAGPAMNDLIGGQIEAVIDQTVTMIPAHLGKTVTALAVTGKARIPQLPDVPTFAEAGTPGFDMVVWNALVAPRGTPKDAMDRLVSALNTALDDPDVKKRLEDLAAQLPTGPERGSNHLRALIASDTTRWAAAIAEAGITAQ